MAKQHAKGFALTVNFLLNCSQNELGQHWPAVVPATIGKRRTHWSRGPDRTLRQSATLSMGGIALCKRYHKTSPDERGPTRAPQYVPLIFEG